MTRPLIPATQLDDDLWLIDLNFQGEPQVIGAYLMTDASGHSLIETGPGSTLPALEAGIRAAGVRFDDIARVFVTHIHLDHAGAAGTILRRLPNATLYVHPLGDPHMIHPERLLKSATRIYGDRMDTLWGSFEPCPPDRVVALYDGDAVDCGSRELVALHTPGHAWHHIAWHDARREALFTGDVGGVRIPGATIVRPPTPPPDIDAAEWHSSVARMRAAKPKQLLMTHFGRFDDVDRHLDELEQQLDEWIAWVGERITAGRSTDAIVNELRERNVADVLANTGSTELSPAYELATPSGMTVDGISRYLSQRHGA